MSKTDFNAIDHAGRLQHRTMTLGEFRNIVAGEPDTTPLITRFLSPGWVTRVRVSTDPLENGRAAIGEPGCPRAIVIYYEPG
jgi:hypothetical protein